MPRHPKPQALRANREHRDLGLVSTAPVLAAIPNPPDGLLAVSRQGWARFWSSPLARVVVPDTDITGLRRLWTLYDERERAMRSIRTKRIVSSRGQLRPNPMYSTMAVLDRTIQTLEDRFGLSPRSRLQLGVILGEAARSLEDLNDDLSRDDDLDDILDDSGALVG